MATNHCCTFTDRLRSSPSSYKNLLSWEIQSSHTWPGIKYVSHTDLDITRDISDSFWGSSLYDFVAATANAIVIQVGNG